MVAGTHPAIISTVGLNRVEFKSFVRDRYKLRIHHNIAPGIRVRHCLLCPIHKQIKQERGGRNVGSATVPLNGRPTFVVCFPAQQLGIVRGVCCCALDAVDVP